MTRAVVALKRSAAEDLSEDVRRLRRDVAESCTEVDLLVVAMRDHIADLRHQRDRLLADVARMRDERRRQAATWLVRGQRPQRQQ